MNYSVHSSKKLQFAIDNPESVVESRRESRISYESMVHAYIALCGLSGLRRRAASCLLRVPVSPSYLCAIVNDSLNVSRALAREETGAGALRRSYPGRPCISSTVVSR